MPGKFQLDKETKELFAGEIQQYFLTERGEELGNLAALLILEFFTEKLATHFYNLGVADAGKFISDKLDDLYSLEK
ncbi:DUF2164 domain-containing protein [Bacillus massilinigeriensis]|uniref:DUF2164 domain-containing protein n=1 Tax=Bacillus mediterraneensis TaxID=1805474 RepID=UPI0008F86213|nr:DUF2164 domain-containing protein [Bacillus mediterraneensis]